jgi:hypothetical protein
VEPQEDDMMSTAGSFPSVRNQGLSTSRRKTFSPEVLRTNSWQDALPASASTWRPAHKQPSTLSPDFSEVVKLTDFAENKGLNEPCGRRIVCREQNIKML